jgi:hypothetical protein
MSLADELAGLAKLLEEGHITQEEFDAQKAKLLGTSPPAGSQPAAAGQAPAQGPAPGQAPPQTPPSTGINPLFIILPIVGVLIIIVLAIVAVPAFIKYNRRAHTSEAIDQLDKMYKGAAVYYATPHVLNTGQKVPCQFPANQGVTPVEGTCCSTNGLGGPDSNGDDRCDSNPAMWDEMTWSALHFQMNGEHYFVYAFDAEGTLKEANFRATANADLDCDSIQSTFQRIAFGDEKANFAECSLHGAPAMFVDQETE